MCQHMAVPAVSKIECSVIPYPTKVQPVLLCGGSDKRIQVNPEASLSLQKHHHHAEHSGIMSDAAEITCSAKKMALTENQSTSPSLAEVHRLVNPSAIPPEIIEVQSGGYPGEVNIVRLDDYFGRRQLVSCGHY